MYEKTLTKGTTKVNNAYEWQKVSYTNKNQTTTTPTTSPKTKQQQQSSKKSNNNKKTILNSAKNATKTHTEHLNATATTTKTTPGTLTVPSSVKPATLFKKFVGNAARRQTLAHQIKRAHRHLLTSGGNDKQPQKQTRNNNSRKSGSSAAAAGQQQAKTTKQQQQRPRNKHIIIANKQSDKQQHQKVIKKQPKQKKRGHDDGNTSELSSRWGSIEEQLNVLDSLLHYDEQADLYIAQLYDKYQLQLQHSSDSNCDSNSDTDDSHCSELAWNWSDYDMEMSNSNNNKTEDDALSSTSGAGSHSTSNSNPSPSMVPPSLKRRGHQHHPRFAGTRRPQVPNVQEILAALYRGDSKGVLSNLRGEVQPPAEPAELEVDSTAVSRSTLSLPLTDSVTNSVGSNSPTPTDESSAAAPAVSDQPEAAPVAQKKKKKKRDKDDQKSDKSERKKKSGRSKRQGAATAGCGVMELSSDSLATDLSAGAIDEGIVLNPEDEDNQAAEWAKLRCTSEAAEIVAEREARRNKGRCADYPGLAFGRSIFSSDTMMKFNIIRNELHNIMNTQLKRVIRRSQYSPTTL